MKVFISGRKASGLLATLSALAIVGCLSVTEPPVTLFWIGSVQSDPGTRFWIGGSAEMVANPAESSVGLFLDADPEFTVTVVWEVRSGRCSGTGDRIAPASLFPPIELTADSRGIALATIHRRIPAGDYAVEVFSESATARTRLACADLTER